MKDRLSGTLGFKTWNRVRRDKLRILGKDTDSEISEVTKGNECKIRKDAVLQMIPANVGLECMKFVYQCNEEGYSE